MTSIKTLNSRSGGKLMDKSATRTTKSGNLVLLCVSLIASYAVAVFIFRPPYTIVSAINLVFYLLLMLNTYFSVSFTESTYGLRCRSDDMINVPLVLLYLGLPWLTHTALWFCVAECAFFTIALIKYANWMQRLEANFFLRRKIIGNGLAALLGLAAVAALLVFERPTIVVGAATLVFTYANVHTLWLDPLYREK